MASGKAIGRVGTSEGLPLTHARRLLAGMLIFLVAFSGLSGAVAKTMAPGMSAHIFCLDGGDAHKDAGRLRRDAGCCILCVIDGDDRAPPRETRLAPPADAQRGAFLGAAIVRTDTGGARHIGWLSTWSSRAPPAFS